MPGRRKRARRAVSDNEDITVSSAQEISSRATSPDVKEVPPAALKATENAKHAAFDKRWKTEERTPKEVLGEQ